MRFAEDELQITCVAWFNLQYQKKIIAHCPNGGKRNKSEAVRFKKMGVLAGVSDLMILEPNETYHGLFIELKIKPNKLTKNQKVFIDAMTSRGFRCEVCYSLNDFIKVVREYFKDES